MEEASQLDGNAIGGLLIEVFGRELTDAHGCCASCGTISAVGGLIVYRSGPGDVVRCPSCSAVVIVATPRQGGPRIFFPGLRWLRPPS